MTFKSILLSITIVIITTTTYAQTENNVDITPHWQKDESHAVKINTTTVDSISGKTQKFLSTFDVKFNVEEQTENGFKIAWTYTNVKLALNEPLVENIVLAKLINTKLQLKLSAVGQFEELLNVDEVRISANKIIDGLIISSKLNPTMNTQFKAIKQLIISNQGLEIALLKQIKFYLFSFGYNYKLNQVQTNNIKFPNPFSGQPFDGLEKVELTKLDYKNSICVVETSKIIDGKTVKIAAIDYIKKVTNSNSKALNEISNAKLLITENTMQQIDFSKGLVQKSFFKRVMKLGFQNRTTVIAIETLL